MRQHRDNVREYKKKQYINANEQKKAYEEKKQESQRNKRKKLQNILYAYNNSEKEKEKKVKKNKNRIKPHNFVYFNNTPS